MTRRLWVPLLHRLAFAILCASAASVHAVNLGPVQLLSGLGQPLRATIQLSNTGTGDLDSTCVKARLKLPDGTFTSAPRISLTHTGSTEAIELSTKQSINEPMLVLQVATGCGSAIYSNYQLLLDPVHRGIAAYPMKAVTFNSQQARRQGRAELSAKVAPIEQSTASIPGRTKATGSAQLPTLTREMRLSPNRPNSKTPKHASTASKNTNWIVEDSVTPILKLSVTLADTTEPDDVQKISEAKAAQMRFVAIINGEDVTQNAEAKMKAAQGKMLLQQAENEKQKQLAQAEKLAQEEKRKVSFPLTWFAALAGSVLLCLAVIAWIARKIAKAKKSQAQHPWKNYHAASDTLIADLSTQTLLDSEFMTTVGAPYNTAVFSDTQFDEDPTVEDDELEDSFEEEPDLAEPVITNPSPVAPRSAEEKNPSTANHVAPKPFSPTAAATAIESDRQPVAMQSQMQEDSTATVLPAPDVRQTARAARERVKHDRDGAAVTAPKKEKETAPTLKVKEIADLMQQAEFWMLLQDPFRAIEVLEPYRDIAHPESPVPWIYLLDLYRMVGDKKKYELLIVRIEHVFNAKIPRWDGQFGITPRTLHDFPHVVEKICALWETDEIVPYLESLLLDQRDGARQGFDLPVYRNIIQLITLAREPEKSKEHAQLRYGKAQAILFSQQTPNPDQVARPVSSQPSPNAATIAKAQAEPVTTDIALTAEIHPSPTVESVVPAEQATADFAPVASAMNADNKNISAPGEKMVVDTPPPQMQEEDTQHFADTAEYGNASSMETKLELAVAYQEIGEKDGARELLYEVIKDGSADQSEKAKLILKGIN